MFWGTISVPQPFFGSICPYLFLGECRKTASPNAVPIWGTRAASAASSIARGSVAIRLGMGATSETAHRGCAGRMGSLERQQLRQRLAQAMTQARRDMVALAR